MCQTAVISNSIVRLGTRSYRQMMEAMTPDACNTARLSRLNRDLEHFYEMLYNQWNTVTESEYAVFGQQLVTLLQTIKELYLACKNIAKSSAMERQVELLGMNYAAIYEVNSDIVNFRIKSTKDQELQQIINEASKRLNNDNF